MNTTYPQSNSVTNSMSYSMSNSESNSEFNSVPGSLTNYRSFLRLPFAFGGAAMVTAAMLFAMYLLIRVDALPEIIKDPVTIIPNIFQEEVAPPEDLPRQTPDEIVAPTPIPERTEFIQDNDETVVMRDPIPTEHEDTGFRIDLGGSDTPIATLRTQPQYPINAINRGIEGWVTLSFDVTRAGTTDNIQVVESEPGTTFDRAAIRALEKWKYMPKTLEGVTMRVNNLQTRLVFELGD